MAVSCSDCGKSLRNSAARADHYISAHPRTAYGKKMKVEKERWQKKGTHTARNVN